MTKDERQALARRAMLRRAAFLTGTEAIPALSLDNPLLAEQKIPRQFVHYHQAMAKDRDCSHCALFLAGEHPDAEGVCRLVAGVISPVGVCDAYAPAETGSMQPPAATRT